MIVGREERRDAAVDRPGRVAGAHRALVAHHRACATTTHDANGYRTGGCCAGSCSCSTPRSRGSFCRRSWAAAEHRGDADLLAGLLADDFVGVGLLGFVLTRDQWL